LWLRTRCVRGPQCRAARHFEVEPPANTRRPRAASPHPGEATVIRDQLNNPESASGRPCGAGSLRNGETCRRNTGARQPGARPERIRMAGPARRRDPGQQRRESFTKRDRERGDRHVSRAPQVGSVVPMPGGAHPSGTLQERNGTGGGGTPRHTPSGDAVTKDRALAYIHTFARPDYCTALKRPRRDFFGAVPAASGEGAAFTAQKRKRFQAAALLTSVDLAGPAEAPALLAGKTPTNGVRACWQMLVSCAARVAKRNRLNISAGGVADRLLRGVDHQWCSKTGIMT